MKIYEIVEDKIIDKRDFKTGAVVVLIGRPAFGKTRVCTILAKRNKDNYQYFNQATNENSYWVKKNKIITFNGLHSSEIIEKIYQNKSKLVIIDNFCFEGKNKKLFIKEIVSMAKANKIVFLISIQLKKKLEFSKNFKKIYRSAHKNVGYADKVVFLQKPAVYSSISINNDDLKFYLIKKEKD